MIAFVFVNAVTYTNVPNTSLLNLKYLLFYFREIYTTYLPIQIVFFRRNLQKIDILDKLLKLNSYF